MSAFPALDAFEEDPTVGRLTFRVFRYLRTKGGLDFTSPREIKTWELAHTLKMRKASIIAKLNWLVDRGYLIEFERGDRGVRRFTLAFAKRHEIP
jgi:hypothetical protein